MCRKQVTLNTWEDTLEITKEDLESFGLTTNPTELISEIKIEGTQFTQDIHLHKDNDVQPLPEDFGNETHPTTVPSPGDVQAKGEEMEIASPQEASRDMNIVQSMLIKQGTPSPDELNVGDDTAQFVRSV